MAEKLGKRMQFQLQVTNVVASARYSLEDFRFDDSWEEKGLKKHMRIKRIEKHPSKTIMLFKNGKAVLTGANIL